MPKIVMAVKKPIPIKFTKFEKMNDHPAVFMTDESPTGLAIMTLENTKIKHEVSLGDWICEGTTGDIYAIKPDKFAATYDIVETLKD